MTELQQKTHQTSNASTETDILATMTKSLDSIAEVRKVIRQGLQRRRQAIVYEIAKHFYEKVIKFDTHFSIARDSGVGWTRIESLSQLRSIVGGRFQNLKRKWVGAGFPLKEHRGEKTDISQEVNHDGWIELSVWISGQGYEVRLAAQHSPWLFEIRKIE
jgi:hypothetical protein